MERKETDGERETRDSVDHNTSTLTAQFYFSPI